MSRRTAAGATALSLPARSFARFYGTKYTVGHPDGYDLTRAKRNQRWIRFGDDLVLVSLRSGRVLEVASNRF